MERVRRNVCRWGWRDMQRPDWTKYLVKLVKYICLYPENSGKLWKLIKGGSIFTFKRNKIIVDSNVETAYTWFYGLNIWYNLTFSSIILSLARLPRNRAKSEILVQVAYWKSVLWRRVKGRAKSSSRMSSWWRQAGSQGVLLEHAWHLRVDPTKGTSRGQLWIQYF